MLLDARRRADQADQRSAALARLNEIERQLEATLPGVATSVDESASAERPAAISKPTTPPRPAPPERRKSRP